VSGLYERLMECQKKNRKIPIALSKEVIFSARKDNEHKM
jgi:hypothetical protein